jgi:hypothetical protein
MTEQEESLLLGNLFENVLVMSVDGQFQETIL